MAPSKSFQEIIDHVAKALKSTSIGYVLSRLEDRDLREALFASVILQSLADYSSILGSLSKIYKKDLNDSIVTHSMKYIKTLEKYASPSDDPNLIKNKDVKTREGVVSDNNKESDTSPIFMPKMQDSQIFQQNLEIVKKALKAPNPKGDELTQEERDSLSVLLSKILDKLKNIFAEQNNNQKEIDYLIALSSILVSSSLPLKDKDNLADDLVNIREIWSLDVKGEYTKDHKKLLFLQSFLQESDYTKLKFADDLLRLIIDQLITEKKLLEDCSDAELLNLYSRLKGNMRFINHFHQLLSELHKESKIRYSCNRVSNEGYDLLNKFQNFDTINNSIELLENIVVESYLLKKDYLREVINHLEVNIASITYLKLSASSNFTNLLDEIETFLKKSSDQSSLAKLSVLKEKHLLDANIIKKFDDLDSFQTHSLQLKYNTTFDGLLKIIRSTKDAQEYLEKILNRQLSNTYYINNASNSVEKLRKAQSDRAELYRLFSKIHLIKIFMSDLEQSSSLNFRDIVKQTENQTPKEYIALFLKNIITGSNAHQLDILYSTINKSDVNFVEKFVKQSIISEVTSRISISNMILAFFSGKKKEYDKLKEVFKKFTSA